MNIPRNLAIVPYEPKKKKFKSLEISFEKRKNAYFTLLVINILLIFLGFTLFKSYGAQKETAAGGFFGFLLPEGSTGPFVFSGIRFMFFSTLILFLSAFTIFCPAISLAFSAFLAFNAGIFIGEGQSFYTVFLLSAFLFFSVLFESEIFYAYRLARFGIKQMFKPQNVIALSVKTILYLLIILLYSFAARETL